MILSYLSDPETDVVNDIVDAQIGDVVGLGDELLLTYIANLTLYQVATKDGDPDSAQIGLLRAPLGQAPMLDATFVDPEQAAGQYMTYLHAVRYGQGNLVLLAWREGEGQDAAFYTMVIDPDGNVCQPKTPVAAEYEFLGDDFVVLDDGRIVWANVAGGQIQVVTLTPQ